MASGLDDAEWHGRLQRGRDLARRAEASRRSAREVQRSAEETIAKQAAELERLRQEAKSRSLGRGRRSHEVRPIDRSFVSVRCDGVSFCASILWEGMCLRSVVEGCQ